VSEFLSDEVNIEKKLLSVTKLFKKTEDIFIYRVFLFVSVLVGRSRFQEFYI
jgi:hypothetical protein